MSPSLRLSDRKGLLFSIGFLAAVLVAAVVWFARNRDNPASKVYNPFANDIAFNYHGVPARLSLTGTYPPYLIQGQRPVLNFQLGILLQGTNKPVLPPEGEAIYWRSYAQAAGVDEAHEFIVYGDELQPGVKHEKVIGLALRPGQGQDPVQVGFELATTPRAGGNFSSLVTLVWPPIPARAPFLHSIAPLAYAGLALVLVVVFVYLADRELRALDRKEQEEIQRAKLLAENNPGQASPAWEAASTNLQAYFKRNLVQVKWVFWVAVAVMLAGFSFVLWGVTLSLHDPNHLTPTSKIATLSGLITQFIGATFMVIYRSTMTQANDFVNVLDRINTVNVAMKVLDSIPESESSIKNATRQQLVNLLLSYRPASRLPKARNSTNKSSKEKGGRESQPARDEG